MIKIQIQKSSALKVIPTKIRQANQYAISHAAKSTQAQWSQAMAEEINLPQQPLLD